MDKEGELMKTVILAGVATILTLILVPACSYKAYVYDRDLNALQGRAQVAADREDMRKYLIDYSANLSKHDATMGHTALIFKTAGNDLHLNYQTLHRIIERLDALEGVPKASTTYQVALDDIRGTLRELMRPAGGLTWVRYAWWILSILGILWGAVCVGGFYHVGRY